MTGEVDLATLLRDMSPRLHDGTYVYAIVPGEAPAGVRPVVTVQEDEGLTLVLSQQDADRLGLTYDFVAAWITLQVHSALEAVGLTAAVSAVLTAAGISCNVVAGFHHDHLFVPYDRADDALSALATLRRPPASSIVERLHDVLRSNGDAGSAARGDRGAGALPPAP